MWLIWWGTVPWWEGCRFDSLSELVPGCSVVPGPGPDDPQSRCVQEATKQCFSLTSKFLSLPSSLFGSRGKKVREKMQGQRRCGGQEVAGAADLVSLPMIHAILGDVYTNEVNLGKPRFPCLQEDDRTGSVWF